MMNKMQSAQLGLCLVVLAAASCGFPRLSELAAPFGLELLAGDIGSCGSGDGTSATARIDYPTGVAVDSAGNVYIGDFDNSIIRKITATGVVTALAGIAGMPGSADGTGAAARFNGPLGVAVDSAGNIYVADFYNSAIRKITASRVVTTLAGTAGIPGSADGTGAAARFYHPDGAAVDSAGNVYVADAGNQTIRKVTATGVVTTLARTAGMRGSADGVGVAARFDYPVGVAVDSAGNVYIGDHNKSIIRKITAAGVVTTLAGTAGMPGSTDGTGAATCFGSPDGVAVDNSGNVYVADAGNQTIRKVTATGVVTTLAGAAGLSGSVDGTGIAARFSFSSSSGVAVDSTGNVYVADSNNCTIRKITAAGGVTTLAGTVGMFGSADGTGAAARFSGPLGTAVDSTGNVYVADQGSSTIRKVTPAGIVTTLAGAAGMYGSADGTGAAARFYYPRGIAVDSTGNVYVADRYNATIRKVTPAGVVTTLAGTAGMLGGADGTGATALFSDPVDVVVDSAGNVYVADVSNSTIRKVTPAGTTTTIAGTAGARGILLGASPRLAYPYSLALVGDSIVVSDANAILLLRHGAQ